MIEVLEALGSRAAGNRCGKRVARVGWVVSGLAIAVGWLGAAEAEGPTLEEMKLQRAVAMVLLQEGNARYVAGGSTYPNQGAERRQATAKEGQEPFVTVLACSDSREPVELIFDRGVGDLFVVRVAGNVAGPSEMATLEYGVGHLHTPLVVVMGHTQCGAVTAAAAGAKVHGHLSGLVARIWPAVDQVKSEGVTREELVPKAIEANVRLAIETLLRSSEEVREEVEQGRVQVVGAVYDLEKGVVKWLGAHPKQGAILAELRAAKKEVLGEAMQREAGSGPPPAPFRPPMAQRVTGGTPSGK